jgi:hypothetical protein
MAVGLFFVMVGCGPASVTVTLSPQGSSTQTGKAVVTEKSASTIEVVIDITPSSAGVPQPAHIHVGTACTAAGAVLTGGSLTSVNSSGKRTTTLNLKFSEVKGKVINVHVSDPDPTVVACGVIP